MNEAIKGSGVKGTDTAAAPESAQNVELEVFEPTGALEATQLHAPRIDNLAGKTICEIWNGHFEGQRTFPLIRELLKKSWPTVKFIPYTELPIGRRQIQARDIGKIVKDKGCDAVIVGNGG